MSSAITLDSYSESLQTICATKPIRVTNSQRQQSRIGARSERDTKIESAFGAENCFFGFYETFISEQGVRSLCDFLDISFAAPKLDFKANPSPRSVEPDPADWEKVREAYSATYAFCADKFGADVVSQAWPGFKPA